MQIEISIGTYEKLKELFGKIEKAYQEYLSYYDSTNENVVYFKDLYFDTEASGKDLSDPFSFDHLDIDDFKLALEIKKILKL